MPGFRLWLLHVEVQHRGAVIFNRFVQTLELCDTLPEGPIVVVQRRIVLRWTQLPSAPNLDDYERLSEEVSASFVRHYRWRTSSTRGTVFDDPLG
jgi:hypothetical protein